jgi:pre-rRNA-processing protein TSR4
MPPYDSESSDEGEEYTETNVLLGYATEDATGDTVSHLGGAPVRPRHIFRPVLIWS